MNVHDNVIYKLPKVGKLKYTPIHEWMGRRDVGESHNIIEIGGTVSGRACA